jgi:hypothetical protein
LRLLTASLKAKKGTILNKGKTLSAKQKPMNNVGKVTNLMAAGYQMMEKEFAQNENLIHNFVQIDIHAMSALSC